MTSLTDSASVNRHEDGERAGKIGTGADAMEGQFVHSYVHVRWTVEEDGESKADGDRDWVLQVRIVDISISRRYPVRISQIEAEREARVVAPMLLRVASEWLA